MSPNRPIWAVERFFSSWRFPVLALAMLAAFEIGLVAVSAVPRADTGLGHFAEQFRVWCWGYDPTTGRWEWAYVITMLGAPLTLGALIAGVWREPLCALAGQRLRAAVPWAGAGVVAVAIGLGALVTAGGDARAAELPFPAQALRTGHRAPEFELDNQDGEPVSLGALRGKVVLLTGMYASCSVTCPLIMAQAKRAIDALEPPERRDVRFVAITLDPAHDDRAALAELARRWSVRAPEYNYLWGDAESVDRLLDRLEIARRMDMATGAIDHANLFVLVDRRGKVAYRLSLSPRNQSWLTDALRVLVRERGAG